MSYEPTNWKAGDTVTSAKLNKLEQGILSNEPLVVHITNSFENETTSKIMDKTWLQIRNAAPNVYFIEESNSDTYYLKTYWLEEIRDTYGMATINENGSRLIQYFPPSITLLLLDLTGNNESYKFETSQAYSKSENPVWTEEALIEPEIPTY